MEFHKTLSRPTLKSGRHILRRHENDQGLSKVAGYMLKDKRIIRIDDNEHGPTRERIEIAGIKTVVLLVGLPTARQTAAINAITLHARAQAAQLIAICKGDRD